MLMVQSFFFFFILYIFFTIGANLQPRRHKSQPLATSTLKKSESARCKEYRARLKAQQLDEYQRRREESTI